MCFIKILNDDAAQELMPVVAGAVFTLTAHLSQSVRTEQKQPLAVPLPGHSQFVLMLDGSFTSPPGSESMAVGCASIGDSSLHIILKKILDFILKTGNVKGLNHSSLLEREVMKSHCRIGFPCTPLLYVHFIQRISQGIWM